MSFFRKKRQQRDRDAGLVFAWRGGKKHHLGKILALMIAVGFFSFAVYAVKIDVVKPPRMPQREGVVFMIDESLPECQDLLLKIEAMSPFPKRWDPAKDQEAMARVDDSLKQLTGEIWSYQPAYEKMPALESSTALPSVIDDHTLLMPELADNWQEATNGPVSLTKEPPLVQAQLVASGALKDRLLQSNYALPIGLGTEDSYGQSFTFSVSVDQDGTVSTCMPLLGSQLGVSKPSEQQQELVNWIKKLTFKPSAEISTDGKSAAIIFGKLTITIEAIKP